MRIPINKSLCCNCSFLLDNKLLEILNWLEAPDTSANHEKALKSRQEETGLWFLESEDFADWMKDRASRIWIYGISGCGKSVLSSAIVQQLAQAHGNVPGKAVIYFFFSTLVTTRNKALLLCCDV